MINDWQCSSYDNTYDIGVLNVTLAEIRDVIVLIVVDDLLMMKWIWKIAEHNSRNWMSVNITDGMSVRIDYCCHISRLKRV